ncbi:serine hydrolase [Cellulophaga omnivescoria]|uniref:serine hydrolase n=1 Tax=Cellulophaga omnivescoria TaxID=1888890 RepID=UPI0009856B62|nr:serine hydrolase [Cellulophaga omnivescoria]WBU89875.1 serine hydrolase [Cellulophaga omnivescoria]
MKPYTLSFLLFALLFSCKEKQQKINHPINYIIASKSDNIKKVLDSITNHEVQFRYTEIKKTNGVFVVNNFDFNTNSNNYFYPASSVKLPIAVLTLEKIFESEGYTKDTEFFIEGDTLKTTFAKEIIKLFTLNNNDAYNRLFEFLGQDYINQKLKEKGVENVRIAHRLATEDADNVTTKPLVIYLNDSTTINTKAIINSPITPLQLDKVKKGTAYIDNDEILQKEPLDFSLKNYYSIDAQQQVLQRIIFPESFKKEQQFNLYEDDLSFLTKVMSSIPKEASYAKFFMYDDTKKPIPNNIKIYNNIGYNYGTLTDCAFIEDTENDISYMLTATILVNKNEVFNDNNYEYETVGIPFLAELGREFYNYNLQKKQN